MARSELLSTKQVKVSNGHSRQTHAELRALQRIAASAIMRPLAEDDRMQRTWFDGRPTRKVVAEFIKPNDRLTAYQRIELYNRQYWFRLIDCMYDDYPGLLAILGKRKFNRLIETYIEHCPSRSYTLRNLGSRLEQYIIDHPALTAPRKKLAVEMARFEWAQVVAFDGETRPAIPVDDLLGANPARLRLGLQPYITLLALNYPLDDYSIAVKRSQQALRSEASNAVENEGKSAAMGKRIALPRPKKVCLAVHRFDNAIYYKRMEPKAYLVLSALRDGATVLDALAKGITVRYGPEQVQQWFQTWMELGWFCRRK